MCVKTTTQKEFHNLQLFDKALIENMNETSAHYISEGEMTKNTAISSLGPWGDPSDNSPHIRTLKRVVRSPTHVLPARISNA